ncbi:MAG: hypothetical protein OEU36_19405 [Gammaproteobacteria bacterium]|nr:hypothetical protein [Gammaproteobacteria bacterium]
MPSLEIEALLDEEIIVINIGLPMFARNLDELGIKVIEVDWSPPASGDSELAHLLSRLGT